MDQRTILAIVLSAAIYYGWLYLRGPEPEPETEVAEVTEEPPAESAPAAEPITGPAPAEAYEAVPEQEVPFSFCRTEGTLSTTAGLRSLTLVDHEGPYDVQPLYSWIWGSLTGSASGGWHPWGAEEPGPAEVLSDRARTLTVGTGAGPASGTSARMAVVSTSDSEIRLEGMTEQGIEVRQRLREGERDGQCVVEVEVEWRNPTGRTFDDGLWVGMHERATDGGGGMTARYSSMRQPTAVVDEGLNYGGPTGAGCITSGTRLGDDEDERAFEIEGPVSWFGISDRYFGMYVVPANPEAGVLWFSRLGEEDEALDGTHLALEGSLGAGSTRTERFTTYVGPNDMAALEMVNDDLSRVVDLGWFSFFGYPLLWALRLFYSALGNWGLAIVMVTVLIKVVFFPLTQGSFRSMQKMQKIQPELNRIREEYKDNPQEQQRKLFEVMQQNQVNPASGCLPMLVQFPVWIALYNVLLTSVDLYHTEFLYLNDLTQPDPYLVLPLAIMGLMFLQQQFTTPSASMDPAQQQVMRLMPLFFGLLFFAFPSGLAVYVFVNMVLSILQQWLIKRSLDSEGTGTPAEASAG